MTRNIRFEVTAELVTETCCNCGMLFAVPTDFQRRRREDHGSFYCPAGHSQYYTGPSEAEKLHSEVNRLTQQEARHEDEKRILRAELDAAQKAKRRIEKRVHAGVCPDCNRTFGNLARHMSTQHKRTCEVVKIGEKVSA